MLCVIYYHTVSLNGEVGQKLSLFTKQIKLLKDFFKIVDLDTVLERIEAGIMPSNKPELAITFDDGFYSNYALVEPILRKEKIKATVFVSTSRVYNKETKRFSLIDYWEGKCSLTDLKPPYKDVLGNKVTTSEYTDDFMTWEELREIEEHNLKVESHGHEHHKVFKPPLELIGFWNINKLVLEKLGRAIWLDKIYGKSTTNRFKVLPVFKYHSYHKGKMVKPMNHEIEVLVDAFKKGKDTNNIKISGKVETEEEMKKRILEDLTTAKKLLEENLDKKIIHLAWPFGEYSETSIELAIEAGYKALYTTKQKAITYRTSQYEIERISVPRKDIEMMKKIVKRLIIKR